MAPDTRTEWDLVIEQRADGFANIVRKPYRTNRFKKHSLEKALKGLADWEERKQEVLGTGATFMENWTAHIETRTVTETPWKKLET